MAYYIPLIDWWSVSWFIDRSPVNWTNIPYLNSFFFRTMFFYIYVIKILFLRLVKIIVVLFCFLEIMFLQTWEINQFSNIKMFSVIPSWIFLFLHIVDQFHDFFIQKYELWSCTWITNQKLWLWEPWVINKV